MTHRVLVRPSGHVYTTEGKSTLLDAGLRSGLNLDHSCGNGSCGECRARLISGQVEQAAHFDFRFTELEKQQGWLLMCCHRASSDLEIETHETTSASEIPEQHITAKIARIEQLQDEVIQLSIRTPRSKGLHFLAGQSAALHFDGMRPKHLPIASCPCDTLNLRFHVRRRPGDAFSDLVFERLKKGREVVVTGPVGDFTLDEESERPLIFIAWESGFAPIASLIDHAIQKDEEREIHLYWLSAIPRGHYLSNYCRSWRDALDHFHYHSIDLRPWGQDTVDGVFRRIVDDHAPLSEWDVYMTLPAVMQYRSCSILCDAGVSAEQLKLAIMQHA